ncbi:MAG: YraN family protein, partial [Thiobacillus sp.]
MLKSLIGQSAEARAEAFLRTQGLKLVARNWRCRFGEIDVIMLDGSTLGVVEVRLGR